MRISAVLEPGRVVTRLAGRPDQPVEPDPGRDPLRDGSGGLLQQRPDPPARAGDRRLRTPSIPGSGRRGRTPHPMGCSPAHRTTAYGATSRYTVVPAAP
jgi:hypothetical protein